VVNEDEYKNTGHKSLTSVITVPSGAVNVLVHVFPVGVVETEYGLQCPWLAATGSTPYCVRRSSWYGGRASSPGDACVGCLQYKQNINC